MGMAFSALSLDDLRELFKEVVGHFLRRRLDQSRSDGRNRSTHLSISLAVQLRLLILLDESDSRGAAHESGRAFALHDERIGFRQLFVLEFQLANVTSFDPRKSEPEVRVVTVLTGPNQPLATLDASLPHRRVGDGSMHFGAAGR